MSREVRMVPANWQHPRYTEDNAPGPWAVGRHIGLHGGDFAEKNKTWIEADRRWREDGENLDFDGKVRKVAQLLIDAVLRGDDVPENPSFSWWDGDQPQESDYMPQWPAEERTHFMMYETTTEGTPISPAFATAEELARWLADTDASAWAGMTVSYEDWLATIHAGSTPASAYSTNGGPFIPSAAGMAEKEKK